VTLRYRNEETIVTQWPVVVISFFFVFCSVLQISTFFPHLPYLLLPRRPNTPPIFVFSSLNLLISVQLTKTLGASSGPAHIMRRTIHVMHRRHINSCTRNSKISLRVRVKPEWAHRAQAGGAGAGGGEGIVGAWAMWGGVKGDYPERE